MESKAEMSRIELNEIKCNIVNTLRSYGDPISNVNMHLRNLKNNLEFVKMYGTMEKSGDRVYMITKLMKVINCNHIYKNIMIEPLCDLEKRVSLYEYYDIRKKLINNLIVLGYKKNYLKNLRVETLHKLLDNPTPYVKSNRKELIDLLSSIYGMSPSTLKGWNFEKIKDAFRKKMSKKYGPLGTNGRNANVVDSTLNSVQKINEDRTNSVEMKPRIADRNGLSDYLRSLSNSLFCDIVYS